MTCSCPSMTDDDVMVLLTFQSGSITKKLPEATLCSNTVKKAVVEYLVKPLLRIDRRFLAFRLVWMHKQHQNSDEIWRNFAFFQQHTCNQLKEIEGIEFFLSVISATVTVPKKDVNPAIAFWIAINPYRIQEYAIYNLMRSNTFGAELKIMTNKTAKGELERQVNNVAMALKDYGAGYVHNKLENLLPDDISKDYRCQQLHMKAEQGTDYPGILMRAQRALLQHGLNLLVETY